jgi:hypothetical protein
VLSVDGRVVEGLEERVYMRDPKATHAERGTRELFLKGFDSVSSQSLVYILFLDPISLSCSDRYYLSRPKTLKLFGVASY